MAGRKVRHFLRVKMRLTAQDMKKLQTAHPDLLLFVLYAAKVTAIPFMVMEVGRSVEQQRLNIKKGVSWTMNSLHILKNGFARASDLVPIDAKGQPIWAWPVYHKLALQLKAAAKTVGVPIIWGGDWKKTPDGPHWELDRKEYP